MTNETPDLLDPISFARFLLMPGAGRLLAAFGDIPPGPLRDSVITHAEVIASTYTGAPPKHRMPDPIKGLARAANVALPPAAPETVTGRAPPSLGERDDQIIRLRLNGVTPKHIAKKLKISPSIVWSVLAKARAAGIDIPKKGDGSKPKAATYPKHWHTSTETMTAQALGASERAAASRGISLEEYLERRRVSVEMAQRGYGYDAILKATGEPDEKVVSAWLSSARKAGIDIPYVGGMAPSLEPLDEPPTDAIEVDAVAPQEPQQAAQEAPPPEASLKAVDPTREPIFGLISEMHAGQVHAMQSAADRRGVTLQAYIERREQIARMGLAGYNVVQIVKELGEDRTFVRDTFASAERRGVKFPMQQASAA